MAIEDASAIKLDRSEQSSLSWVNKREREIDEEEELS